MVMYNSMRDGLGNLKTTQIWEFFKINKCFKFNHLQKNRTKNVKDYVFGTWRRDLPQTSILRVFDDYFH